MVGEFEIPAYLPSLQKLTASLHLKMDGWNMFFCVWKASFHLGGFTWVLQSPLILELVWVPTSTLPETNIAPENGWLED